MNKRAVNPSSIHHLIAERWSPRAFDATREVSAQQIAALLEAARWSPSSMNEQPWRFLVFDRVRDGAGWQAMLEVLGEKNRLWAKNAPLLLLAVAHEKFSRNDKPNRWAQYDTGQAVMSLVLQAHSLGLASHQIGGFDAERAREAFAIPVDHTPMAAIAVGYEGALDVLVEEFREREQAPRERLPLAELAFSGRWGQGVNDEKSKDVSVVRFNARQA